MVPDSTPDLRYNRLASMNVSAKSPQTGSNVYRKPTTHSKSRPHEAMTSKSTGHAKKKMAAEMNRPLRYANKHNSLYNSWEGLHQFRIQDDPVEEEEPLVYRFRLNPDRSDEASVLSEQTSHKNKRNVRAKTPPKDPFKESVLSDIGARHRNKMIDAALFSLGGDCVQGQPVTEEGEVSGYPRLRHLHLPEHEFETKPRVADADKNIFLLDGSARGSDLFQKLKQRPRHTATGDDESSNAQRVITGRTVLRNPLSPVPLKHRQNPVVVMKSRLDDYADAINTFLEQVVEEQRAAMYEKQPLPLKQTVENTVIYNDFDTIQYFKAMQRQFKRAQEFEKRSGAQYNFKAPDSNVARGVARVQKLGALVGIEELTPLPGSGLKPTDSFNVPLRPAKNVRQQPNQEQKPLEGESKAAAAAESVFLTSSSPEDVSLVARGHRTPRPNNVQQQVLLMNAAIPRTPTSAPPNTPHIKSAC